MPEKQQLVRVVIFCYRNPHLSEDEFHKQWREKHAPLVQGWLAKHGVVRYAQIHTPSQTRQLCGKVAGSLAAASVAEYDGYAEVWVRDVEDLVRAREDSYYKEVVAPDEERLFDVTRNQLTVGWEEVYVDGNQIVEVRDEKEQVPAAVRLRSRAYSLPTCQ